MICQTSARRIHPHAHRCARDPNELCLHILPDLGLASRPSNIKQYPHLFYRNRMKRMSSPAAAPSLFPSVHRHPSPGALIFVLRLAGILTWKTKCLGKPSQTTTASLTSPCTLDRQRTVCGITGGRLFSPANSGLGSTPPGRPRHRPPSAVPPRDGRGLGDPSSHHRTESTARHNRECPTLVNFRDTSRQLERLRPTDDSSQRIPPGGARRDAVLCERFLPREGDNGEPWPWVPAQGCRSWAGRTGRRRSSPAGRCLGAVRFFFGSPPVLVPPFRYATYAHPPSGGFVGRNSKGRALRRGRGDAG